PCWLASDPSRDCSGSPRGSQGVAGRGKTILHPSSTAIPETAYRIAALHHPAWERCTPFARSLMARNAMVILGEDFSTPARFVIYWRDPVLECGGTLHALRTPSPTGSLLFESRTRSVSGSSYGV